MFSTSAIIFALNVCMTRSEAAAMNDWSLPQIAAGSAPTAAGIVNGCRSLLIFHARAQVTNERQYRGQAVQLNRPNRCAAPHNSLVNINENTSAAGRGEPN